MLRIIAILCLSTAPAFACWDGHLVQTDRISFRGDAEDWDPAQIRRYAQWLPRLQALLPAGAFIRDMGTVEVCQSAATRRDEPACVDLGWAPDMPALFKAIQAHFKVSATRTQAARALGGHAYTVQIGSLSSSAGARRMQRELYDSLNTQAADAALLGFVEYGGFPANNAVVQVWTGRTHHRVVVGAFLDRAAAQKAARILTKTHGLKGFVRRL